MRCYLWRYCGCFDLNSLVEKCRIHHSCDPVDMASVKKGWRYYLIVRNYLIKYHIKCMFRNQSKLYIIYISYSHLAIYLSNHSAIHYIYIYIYLYNICIMSLNPILQVNLPTNRNFLMLSSFNYMECCL